MLGKVGNNAFQAAKKYVLDNLQIVILNKFMGVRDKISSATLTIANTMLIEHKSMSLLENYTNCLN